MVRSIPQFESLREEWDALAAGARSPLLDHDWFLSCVEAFYRDRDLRILTVRQGGVLVGAAPLGVESTASGARVTLLGVSKLYEPSGWLFASQAALLDLLERVIGLGRPILLQRVPADSPLADAVAALPVRRAKTVVRSAAPSLAVSTRQSWETYYGTLSSHITSNLPRLRRKAEKALGPMRVEQCSARPCDVDDFLELMIAVEGSGWKGENGSALRARADLREFFRRYCRRAAERGRLRVSTLSFGDRVAAAELSIEAYNRLWQFKIGYNDALKSYYPGLHLTEASIRHAFERRLDAYEFLGSAEVWETRWRPDTRHYRLLAVYPWNARGMIGACRDLARVLSSRTSRAHNWMGHVKEGAGERVAQSSRFGNSRRAYFT